MIKFKYKNKSYKSTELTDALVTLVGGTTVITVLDYLISIQDSINIFIK
ncbi:TreN [Staphylococcus phage vB_SepM_ phiIPLA-C1C]|uniref:TreN n=2 Tax=Sepunavirus TaxID=1980928 RepID=A0A0D3MWH0_9CAUD|nr:hypothetical protein [Finegoldia magna]YP_009214610.1 TreN-like membrane protein [Staphylococcus phage phiIPLA-C1C]YP_009601073.1 TreN-like membrane protein [Staphylococcus phage phiIBB-SEP1]MDU5634666.1 hypothetical protein [Staphylococcus epidermidis]WEU70499.1 TreN-like membrane protein [Staphylococcus phage vB_SepM_BE25]AGR48276.1 putative membrane protein [Staphylococcus phage phiIBB-SEP1]AJA42330.1 TreN [Staphylococcus phage phiIPLA-C1C]MDU1011242.1 hypothetical protein [Finegoldia 